MTTTEAVVADFPKEEKEMVGGMGAGGMGGMDYWGSDPSFSTWNALL